MPLATGHRLGSYVIVAPLGAGGMGEVYRARDTRLGREVAIKALPEGFARDPERLARFEREAQLLASLNHANIAAIYGLEEADGRPHLVLELVPGESLGARLARGPLTVRETLDAATQLAAAIEAAHERGIVHRDLKPANVMLTSTGSVKVLDFGLAKSSEGATSTTGLSMSPTMAATGTGVILGTAAYMSPEQARGQAVDRRTDVWAFGCVLYECLAGRAPFAGETTSDLIARILEREPDWSALPPAVPPRLRELVRRCLAKPAAERPRDIGDLRLELAAIAAEGTSGLSSATPSEKPSLAVLYFENASHDPESEYFCAGVTEDILTDLSKIRGLRVASRNAVAKYRGAPADPARVGSELKVGAVLEGSVRRAGDRVRITVQLVSAADGFQIWAERYDRTLQDVFAVQEEIASSIAEALRVALSPAEVATIAKQKPADASAYDLYLKGRQLYGEYTDASLREAMALFERAIEIDPGYALAYAGVADCCGQLCQWGVGVDIEECTGSGLVAARKAISLDPRLPEAYKAEALNLRFSGDHEGEVASLRRALQADPRFAPALLNLTVQTMVVSQLAEGERLVRRVLENDPQDPFAWTWLAWICLSTRRDDDAGPCIDRALACSTEPFYASAAAALRVQIALHRGDTPGALRAVQQGREMGARDADLRAAEAAIAAFQGRLDEVRRILTELKASDRLVASSVILAATAACRAGELEPAVAFITAPVMNDLAATFVRLEPDLHPLLQHPRFAPSRLDRTLVWPLEAPMLLPSVHRTFREVRIESGLPETSDVRPRPDRATA